MEWREPTATSSHVPIEERGPGTQEMELQKITGALYICVLSTKDMIAQMDIIHNLPLKDDDIFTVGFPRSGNHWTFEILSMILHQKLDYDPDHFHTRLLEWMGPEVEKLIDNLASPRHLSLHARISKVPEDALRKGNKIIYLLRNPKDAWVSEYIAFSQVLDKGHKFQGTWSDFFECAISDKFILGSWFDHALATEAFIARHPDHPVYISSYERMKENPIQAIKDLCGFLGRPDTLAEEIAAATEFKTMTPALNTGKMKQLVGEHIKEGQNYLLRKGVIGDWRNWFTVAQNEAFDKRFKEIMPADSKIARIVKPYMDMDP